MKTQKRANTAFSERHLVIAKNAPLLEESPLLAYVLCIQEDVLA